MRGLTKMMMVNRDKSMQSQYRYDGYETRRDDTPGMRINYDPSGNYVENRFRDRRGREHYNNGRYAPVRSSFEMREIPPVYEGENELDRTTQQPRQIGFSMNPESHYGETGQTIDELEHYRSMRNGGHARHEKIEMTQKTAAEWVKSMENSDGSSGEHWTFEQTHQLLKQKGFNLDPVEFYATMNMLWSDYGSISKKYGSDNPDFWAEMAKAFLLDKDAKEGKLMLYYDCIVDR